MDICTAKADAISVPEGAVEPSCQKGIAHSRRRMAAMTKGLKSEEMAEIGLLRDAGAIAFTNGKTSLADAKMMRNVLAYAKDFGALIIHHLEEPTLAQNGVMNEGEVATRLGLPGIPREAETIMLGPHIFPGTEAGGDPRACPSCETGRLSLKIGKFGAFIGCSNYPDCRLTRQLADGSDKTGAFGSEGKLLGTDPETELDVTLRTGRFGPYVQLGENGEEKPKRASIPKGFDPEGIDLTRALSLLSLPREIGAHPETGKPITAGFGRFGPYVQNDGKYASLSGADEVFTVGINRAVSLLAEKAANRIRRGATVIKDLGEHPELKGAVQVLSGRYGPYVKHGKINATLPKDRNPEEVTMADAVELIAARAAKGPAKKPARKASKAKKTKKEKEVVEETAH